MLAYRAYSNQTDLKRDQAAHFRATITGGQTQPSPRLAALPPSSHNGTFGPITFTWHRRRACLCRRGESASGDQRVGDKGICIVAIAGSDGMSCWRCVAFVQGGDLASPVIHWC